MLASWKNSPIKTVPEGLKKFSISGHPNEHEYAVKAGSITGALSMFDDDDDHLLAEKRKISKKVHFMQHTDMRLMFSSPNESMSSSQELVGTLNSNPIDDPDLEDSPLFKELNGVSDHSNYESNAYDYNHIDEVMSYSPDTPELSSIYNKNSPYYHLGYSNVEADPVHLQHGLNVSKISAINNSLNNVSSILRTEIEENGENCQDQRDKDRRSTNSSSYNINSLLDRLQYYPEYMEHLLYLKEYDEEFKAYIDVRKDPKNNIKANSHSFHVQQVQSLDNKSEEEKLCDYLAMGLNDLHNLVYRQHDELVNLGLFSSYGNDGDGGSVARGDNITNTGKLSQSKGD